MPLHPKGCITAAVILIRYTTPHIVRYISLYLLTNQFS